MIWIDVRGKPLERMADGTWRSGSAALRKVAKGVEESLLTSRVLPDFFVSLGEAVAKASGGKVMFAATIRGGGSPGTIY